MQNLTFAKRPRSPLRILCLGAHSDDIEIGCGGTILRLLHEHPGAQVYWAVLGATGIRKAEAAKSARIFLAQAGRSTVVIEGFRDGYFPQAWAEIKDFLETLKKAFAPDLILTHQRADLHQDHRLVSELTWNTFRDHLILEYEIFKYDGDLGTPNVFVPLAERTVRKKIGTILSCFGSQRGKRWFTEDTFAALLRLRGVESNAPGRHAEAFYGRKVVY